MGSATITMKNNSSLLSNDGIVTRRNIYELAALQVANELAFAYYAVHDDCSLESLTVLFETYFDRLKDECTADDDDEVYNEDDVFVSDELVELFGKNDGMHICKTLATLAAAVLAHDADTIELCAMKCASANIFEK